MLFIRGLSGRKKKTTEKGMSILCTKLSWERQAIPTNSGRENSCIWASLSDRLLDIIQSGTDRSVKNGSCGVVPLSTVIMERSKLLPWKCLDQPALLTVGWWFWWTVSHLTYRGGLCHGAMNWAHCSLQEFRQHHLPLPQQAVLSPPSET